MIVHYVGNGNDDTGNAVRVLVTVYVFREADKSDRSLAEEKQELKQEIAEAGDNGIQRMAELNQRLIKGKRMDDLVKASADEAYRQQLFEELGI